LLDVARIDTGRLRLRRDLVDLCQLTRRVVDRIGGAGTHRRLTLVATEPVAVEVDGDKIDRLLTNLVENALRHGAGAVDVAVCARGTSAVVTVDDEGPGIPVEDRTAVFEKFWQGRDTSGTGLGLYIVQGLADAHGGAVSVADAPTGGARFELTLPRADDPPPAAGG